MTGPEHYREAERLLAAAARWEKDIFDDLGSYAAIDSARQAAHAHATLALAAATFTGGGAGLPADSDTAEEWRRVIVRPRVANTTEVTS